MEFIDDVVEYPAHSFNHSVPSMLQHVLLQFLYVLVLFVCIPFCVNIILMM
jgi:hypothetical protein